VATVKTITSQVLGFLDFSATSMMSNTAQAGLVYSVGTFVQTVCLSKVPAGFTELALMNGYRVQYYSTKLSDIAVEISDLYRRTVGPTAIYRHELFLMIASKMVVTMQPGDYRKDPYLKEVPVTEDGRVLVLTITVARRLINMLLQMSIALGHVTVIPEPKSDSKSAGPNKMNYTIDVQCPFYRLIGLAIDTKTYYNPIGQKDGTYAPLWKNVEVQQGDKLAMRTCTPVVEIETRLRIAEFNATKLNSDAPKGSTNFTAFMKKNKEFCCYVELPNVKVSKDIATRVPENERGRARSLADSVRNVSQGIVSIYLFNAVFNSLEACSVGKACIGPSRRKAGAGISI